VKIKEPFLSYFADLTYPEIAKVLGLSRATVERRWSQARSWLRRELSLPAPDRQIPKPTEDS